PQFTGLTKGDGDLSIPFSVPSDGDYRLLVHGGSPADTMAADLGGQRIKLQKLTTDRTSTPNYIDFTYFYLDISLVAGKHVLQIRNSDQNAVVAESLTALPTEQLPKDFSHAQTTAFQLAPGKQTNTLMVRFAGGQK